MVSHSGVMRDLGERGTRRPNVISGRFSETGKEGRELDKQIIMIARSYAAICRYAEIRSGG